MTARAEDINWNWASAGYADTWHEPAYEVLARYIPDGSKILEIGAGASHALAALAGRKGCDAYGVEPDVDGIAATHRFARMESSSVKMVRGSGFELPFDGESFDVVYSQGLIEHFPEDDAHAFLVEHARVCRKGGTVIVSVPNVYNFPHTLYKAWMGERYVYSPERSYSPRFLAEMLKTVGLSVTNADGILPLWVVTNHRHGWWLSLALNKTGIQALIDNVPNPKIRSRIGFMTFAIARK